MQNLQSYKVVGYSLNSALSPLSTTIKESLDFLESQPEIRVCQDEPLFCSIHEQGGEQLLQKLKGFLWWLASKLVTKIMGPIP